MRNFRMSFCVLFIFIDVMLAQQDPHFSHYMFLNSYINPAACGINNTTDISFAYRNQWLGNTPSVGGTLIGSPITQVLSASTKIQQINSGVGLFIINDQLGPIQNVNAMLSYAYHLNLGEDVKLSIGIRGGVFNQSINPQWIPPSNFFDQTLDFVRTSPTDTKLDVGAGLWLNAPRYYVGLSVAHLNQARFFMSPNSRNLGYINRHYYLTGGYNFIINENWTITPSAIVKSDLLLLQNAQIDISTRAIYKNDLFWGGVSYRSSEAVVVLVGVGLLKDHSLKVGYAFDLIVNASNAKSGTSHELLLTYSKNISELIARPIIRTPRFRF